MQPKPARVLIDGYNLLFQSQLVGRGRTKGWLDRARERLLELLEQGLSDDTLPYTEIVFDAAKFGPTAEDLVRRSGLVVTYSRQHPEADDLIEERIRGHPHPKSLNVISADHRIQKSAKTRRATITEPEAFLNQLESNNRQPSRRPLDSIRPEHTKLEEQEIAYWLEQFEFGEKTLEDD